jgi:Flp pilus assembly pilin Flp
MIKSKRPLSKRPRTVAGAKYPRRGSAAIEYALMVGLIAVVVVSTVQDLGTQVESILRQSAAQFTREAPPANLPSTGLGGIATPVPSVEIGSKGATSSGTASPVDLQQLRSQLSFPADPSPPAQIIDPPPPPTSGSSPFAGTGPIPTRPPRTDVRPSAGASKLDVTGLAPSSTPYGATSTMQMPTQQFKGQRTPTPPARTPPAPTPPPPPAPPRTPTPQPPPRPAPLPPKQPIAPYQL